MTRRFIAEAAIHGAGLPTHSRRISLQHLEEPDHVLFKCTRIVMTADLNFGREFLRTRRTPALTQSMLCEHAVCLRLKLISDCTQ